LGPFHGEVLDEISERREALSVGEVCMEEGRAGPHSAVVPSHPPNVAQSVTGVAWQLVLEWETNFV
jgi:hypothetical protein